MSKKLGDNTQGEEQHRLAVEPGSLESHGDCYAGLDALLEQLAGAVSNLNAPAAVRNRCLSEARLHAAESWRGPGPVELHTRSGARFRMLTLSAVALLAVAAVSWSVLGSGDLKPLSRFLPGGSRLSAAASAVAESDAQTASDDSIAANSADYTSLPYSDPSIANGTETTLEVSMPVSQLMAWGVAAPGRGPDEVIPVDLVLGDDGLPRAVQILPETSSTSSTEELYP